MDLEKGYTSFSFDFRGHGQSGGIRGHIDSFNEYLYDILKVYQYFSDEIGENNFLVGHSMGGLALVRHLEENSDTIPHKAAILSSPFLGIKMQVPVFKKVLSKVLHRVYPTLAVPTELDSSHLSHDPQIPNTYDSDPNVLSKATVGWFEEVQTQFDLALGYAYKIKSPVHVLMAGDDKIVDGQKTVDFYDLLNDSLPKSIKIFDNLYHEIFNEKDKSEIWERLLKVFEGHLK